jgi:hypothetical protein
MMREEFEPLELWAGWRAFGREFLPNPLLRRSAEEAAAEDFAQTVARAADRLAARWNDELYSALVTVAVPDARVEVIGWFGRKRVMIRLHAAVRGTDGVLLVQKPGIDADHGGPIVLMRTPAANVGQRVVTALPPGPAGRHGALRVGVGELKSGSDEEFYQPNSWLEPNRGRPAVLTATQSIRQLNKQQRTLDLDVCVFAGPDVVDEPVPDYQAELVDIAADGRYLVRCTDRAGFSLEPADQGLVARQLQQALDHAARSRSRL